MRRLAILTLILCLFVSTYSFTQKTIDKMNMNQGPIYIDGTDMFLKDAQDFYKEHGRPTTEGVKKEPIKTALGETTTFWAMEPATKQFVQVEAELRKITKHAYIYVEVGQNVSETTIENFTREFDDNIYPNDHKYFGSEWKPGIDFDDRVTMLFLDIKDGYDPQTSPGFVAGYFFPLNEYSTRVFEYSNEREMLYIDTNPADPNSEMTYSVIAHEFQHMIHWNEDPEEEIWLNEACSQLAMRTCGYEHPNQIFAYMRNPELSLTAWAKDVMLENYGAVYLFNYYLASKFSGDDMSKFSLTLAKNQLKGIDSVKDTLKKIGVSKNFEDIFIQWTIANLINNKNTKYYYDDTINAMHLHPKKVHGPNTGEDMIKGKSLSWGTDYIQFSASAPLLPLYPSFIDKMTFTGKKAGKVIWGVNGWKSPISDYIPDGSSSGFDGVITPLKDDFTAQIGPFRKVSSQNVKELNFYFEYADGTTSPEYNVPVCDLTMSRAPRGNTLKIEFDGANDSWWPFKEDLATRLFMVKMDSMNPDNTATVEEIDLDSDFNATITVENYGTIYDTVVLIPFNPTKNSSVAYKYRASLVDEIRNEEKDIDYLSAGVLNSLLSKDASTYMNYIERLDILKENLPEDRLHELDSRLPDVQSLIEGKSDDGDTAHSNIDYLIHKKEEIIEGLTHLKIDPVWLEGQIKQMLTLLEINLHFPHIPFPNGLALKNYDEDLAKEYLQELRLKGDALTEKDKEVLRRLTIAENYIEKTYDMSLMLAEDTTMSVFKLILLFANSTEIINNIMDGLSDAPILGPFAETIKYKLIEKLTIAFQKVIKFAARKMPSPYSSIVPTASDIMVKIFFKIMKIDPESDQMSAGFMKELVVKTAGKYILSSVPKIGYVPMTQKHIDRGMQLVDEDNFTSDYKEAQSVVMDGEGSILATANQNVMNTLNTTAKDREIAGITNAISNVASITSIVDPTMISKIVSIVGKVASGGLMVHAIYKGGDGYYRDLPASNKVAVENAFFPGRNVNVETMPTYKSSSNKMAKAVAIETQDLIQSYVDLTYKLSEAISKNAANTQDIIEKLIEKDDELKIALSKSASLISISPERNSSTEADEVLKDMLSFEATQAQVYSDLLLLDYSKGRSNFSVFENRFADRVNDLSEKANILVKGISREFTKSFSTPAFISLSHEGDFRKLKAGEKFSITVALSNIGSSFVANSKFLVNYPENIEVEKDNFNVSLSQGETTYRTIKGRVKYDSNKGLSCLSFSTQKDNMEPDCDQIWIEVK